MACACTNIATLAGLCKPCDGSLGGIIEVYLAPWQKDIYTEGTDGEVSAVTSGVTFYKYQFRKNTGSMSSALNVSEENGNSVTTTLSLVFSKMETKKRIEMNALMALEVAAIVLDANGHYWALGADNPLTASEGAGETGTAKTDGNRYTISLQDDSLKFPAEVPSSVFAGLTIQEATN